MTEGAIWVQPGWRVAGGGESVRPKYLLLADKVFSFLYLDSVYREIGFDQQV